MRIVLRRKMSTIGNPDQSPDSLLDNFDLFKSYLQADPSGLFACEVENVISPIRLKSGNTSSPIHVVMKVRDIYWPITLQTE